MACRGSVCVRLAPFYLGMCTGICICVLPPVLSLPLSLYIYIYMPPPPKKATPHHHIPPPPHNKQHTPTGTPSPAALRRDAECLVRMVREELGAKRVGLHGESVGGLVAAHAAARCVGSFDVGVDVGVGGGWAWVHACMKNTHTQTHLNKHTHINKHTHTHT